MSASELQHLFHIVAQDEWAASGPSGEYRAASLDTEGFIHCSFAAQVRGTLARHYQGARGLLVVELDPSRIAAPIRVEHSSAAGARFPHVYGPIPVDAAVATHSADRWLSGPARRGGAASPDR
jgi:uncharacterized protein (DUF952 family)